ncbi:MAG: SET domain-containing protein [Planctomycetota bacterium]
MLPSYSIEVRESENRGLGVFARRDISEGELIEEVPVLVVPENTFYSPQGTSPLSDYVFVWDDGLLALPLGFGALYNHSYSPNAYYEDTDDETKCYVALRDIEQGEEITINYNGEPDDDSPVGFDVV